MNATEDPQRKLAPPVNTPYVKVLDLEQTLSGLTEMVDLLRTERDDLEIALTTAIEHGDAIESQLATANVQLQKEVLERRNVEKQLRLLVATITEKSRDLELVLQTITEHADQIDMEWLKRYIESESAARHDSLTGLANRRMLDEAIASEWARGRRESRPVAMLMCDVDHFKEYNDLHGHRAGDECLRRIADVLGGALHRKGDLAARYGGEEFIVLLPNTDREGARAIAANIQRALAHEAIEHGNSPLGAHITLSIGVSAMVPENGDEGPLFAEVDRLLYQAKQQGRNRIVA